jgi:LmbE family N-acetylglucosaminyl deacetylase
VIALLPVLPADEPLQVLCLGAHCDDVEIGCGGTVRHLIARPAGAIVRYEVFASTAARRAEAEAAAAMLLEGAYGATVAVSDYRESYFPFLGDRIKDRFEEIKTEFAPHLVLTHYRHDRHQDHRVLSDLAWNTFRDRLILEYEIPKWDGDLGTPNLFVPLDGDEVRQKLRIVMEAFPSQADKPWFDEETFRGLMRLRGMECNAPSRYAEAFYCRKAVIV